MTRREERLLWIALLGFALGLMVSTLVGGPGWLWWVGGGIIVTKIARDIYLEWDGRA